MCMWHILYANRVSKYSAFSLNNTVSMFPSHSFTFQFVTVILSIAKCTYVRTYVGAPGSLLYQATVCNFTFPSLVQPFQRIATYVCMTTVLQYNEKSKGMYLYIMCFDSILTTRSLRTYPKVLGKRDKERLITCPPLPV